jgi:signal transduction histidine kinase
LNSKRPQFSYNEKQLRDAAAAEVMLQLGSGHDLDDDDGKSSNRKRKHLNPDEKVKQSRDRNREHAKNTRLRKKAYVTKLKELVDQMTRQKENEERDRRVLGEKIHDTVSQLLAALSRRMLICEYHALTASDPTKHRPIVSSLSSCMCDRSEQMVEDCS